MLLLALILLVPLTLLTATMAQRNTQNERMSGNYRDGERALLLADSAIGQALAILNASGGADNGFDDELAGGGDLGLNGVSFGGGSFSVTLQDNDDGDGAATTDSDDTVILNAVGFTAGGDRAVDVIVRRGPAPSEFAILTQEPLKINGNLQLTGSGAGVHSNTAIDIPGDPLIDGLASTPGSISISGTPTLNGGTDDDADPVAIPHIYPPDFRAYAGVVLTADCRVTDAGGVQLADLGGGGTWHGWSCSSGHQWTMADSAPAGGLYDGFYYVEGNAVISGSPGGTWNLTLIADGYIDISGNPNYSAYADAGHPSEIQDLLFVAGNDLSISGSPAQVFAGSMAAHMEVTVSGNPHYQGRVVAENGLYHAGQEVLSGQLVQDLVTLNEFAGNPTHVNTGLSPWGPIAVRRLAWRERVD